MTLAFFPHKNKGRLFFRNGSGEGLSELVMPISHDVSTEGISRESPLYRKEEARLISCQFVWTFVLRSQDPHYRKSQNWKIRKMTFLGPKPMPFLRGGLLDST